MFWTAITCATVCVVITLTVDTATQPLAACVAQVLDYLHRCGLLPTLAP